MPYLNPRTNTHTHTDADTQLAGLSHSSPLSSPQVLATGLSALYSSLPRKIEVRGDDWHALRREDWMGVSSLVLFMNSLEFCNAVVQVSGDSPSFRHENSDRINISLSI